jgi:hypothetical protein
MREWQHDGLVLGKSGKPSEEAINTLHSQIKRERRSEQLNQAAARRNALRSARHPVGLFSFPKQANRYVDHHHN